MSTGRTQTSRSGTTVTATDLAYHAVVPSGGVITFGFNASGAPVTPAPITLNGRTCS